MKIDKVLDAHELAENEAGFENPDAHIERRENEDGSLLWVIEMSSDVTVYVSEDGTVERKS